MPKIPVYQEDRSALPTYPAGVEIQANTGVARGLESFGGDLAKLGMHLEQKRIDAANQDFLTKSLLEDDRAADAIYLDAKQKASAGGPTVSEAMNNFWQDRFSQRQDQAPTNEAKADYQKKAGALFNESTSKARYADVEIQAFTFQDTLTNQIQLEGRRQVEMPNAVTSMKSQAFLEDSIKKAHENGVINSDAALRLIDASKKQQSESLLDGLYQAQRYNSAKKLITSKATPVQGLTADREAYWLLRLDKAMQNKVKINTVAFNADKEDLSKASLEGKIDPNKVQELITQNDVVHAKNPEMAVRGFAEIYSNATTANEIASNKQHAYQNIVDEKHPYISDITKIALVQRYGGKPGFEFVDKIGVKRGNMVLLNHDSSFAEAILKPVQDKLIQKQKQLQRGFEADSANYVIDKKTFPEVANAWTKARTSGDPNEYQKAVEVTVQQELSLGLPQKFARPIPKEESKFIADQFMASSSPDNQAAVMKSAQDRYGPHFFEVWKQVARDDPRISKDAVFAAYTGSESGAKTVLQFSNKENDQNLQKAMQEKNIAVRKLLEASSYLATRDLRDVAEASGGVIPSLQYQNEMQKYVLKQAQTLSLQGKNPVTAATEAVDTLFPGTEVIKMRHPGPKEMSDNLLQPYSNNNGQSSIVSFVKKSDGDKDKVENFIADSTTESGIRSAIDSGLVGIPKPVKDLKPQEGKDATDQAVNFFYGHVFWISLGDNKFMMVYKDNKGKEFSVDRPDGNKHIVRVDDIISGKVGGK